MRSVIWKYLNKLEETRRLYEAGMPNVGIFWVKPDKSLIIDSLPWRESQELVGDWVNYSDHYKFWNRYRLHYKLVGDYTSLPRGRVVFNQKTRTAKIIAGKKLVEDDKLIKKIAREFRLSNYGVEEDEHYNDAIQIDANEYGDEEDEF